MSQSDLTGLLANISAPRKLVIIDTCHAQPARATQSKPRRSRRAANDDGTSAKILSEDTGVTVLAATTTDEEALEGYKNHGLFTYVVSQGLDGAAGPSKPTVTNVDLAGYVLETVPGLATNLFKHQPEIPAGRFYAAVAFSRLHQSTAFRAIKRID